MTTRKTTAKNKIEVSSAGSGQARVLSDADLKKLGEKVAQVQASASPDAKSSDLDIADLARTLSDLHATVQASNAKRQEAEATLSTVQAKLVEAEEQAKTAETALTAEQAKTAALSQEIAAHQLEVKASGIALKANTLRSQAQALVAKKKMTPADMKELFGSNDVEYAEKVQAMASDDVAFTFAEKYVERLSRFTPIEAASTATTELEVVEPRLSGSNDHGQDSVGSRAAALVAAQYKRPS